MLLFYDLNVCYFFSDCWSSEPDNRPTINQVVDKLKAIIKGFQPYNPNTIIQLPNKQLNSNPEKFSKKVSKSNSSLHGDLSQLIQSFNKMNMSELHNVNNASIRIDIIINTSHIEEKTANLDANGIYN